MATKNLNQCRKFKDFEKYAEQKAREGLCEVEQAGNHTKVKVPGKRPTVISRSSGEPSRGLLKAMVKQFIAIGLGLAAYFVFF